MFNKFNSRELRDIEILMLDHCTRSEAEKHLKRGSVVFEDLEEHFEDYMNDWGIETEDVPEYRKMIDEKKPLTDWGVVEHDGKTFYIMYCL